MTPLLGNSNGLGSVTHRSFPAPRPIFIRKEIKLYQQEKPLSLPPPRSQRQRWTCAPCSADGRSCSPGGRPGSELLPEARPWQNRTTRSDDTRVRSCEPTEVPNAVRELTGKIYWKMGNRYYAVPFIYYENSSAGLARYNLPRQPKVRAVWQYRFPVRTIAMVLLYSGPREPSCLFSGGSSRSCCGKPVLSLTPTHAKCHYKPTLPY